MLQTWALLYFLQLDIPNYNQHLKHLTKVVKRKWYNNYLTKFRWNIQTYCFSSFLKPILFNMLMLNKDSASCSTLRAILFMSSSLWDPEADDDSESWGFALFLVTHMLTANFTSDFSASQNVIYKKYQLI